MPFLAGDPADEQDDTADRGRRRAGRSASTDGSRRYSSQVDAVVDDVDPLGIDREVREHVVARFLRDGDDRVGILDAGPLDPGADRW